MAAEARARGAVVRKGYEPNSVWGLDLASAIPGRTWWWWWWVFMFTPRAEGGAPRQVRIMHTTRLAKWARVEGERWAPSTPARPVDAGGDGERFAFSGLAAAWYFDGDKVHHPWLLKALEYESSVGAGGAGALVPRGRDDLAMRGDGARYEVGAASTDAGQRMAFSMRQWTPELSEHEYSAAQFAGRWRFEVTKVPAMRMTGEIQGRGGEREAVEGTAYFQRVRVDAPTVPWVWGIAHADPGVYLDYFEAHIGLDMFGPNARGAAPRRAGRPWLRIPTTVEFIDGPAGRVYEFPQFEVSNRLEPGGGLPTHRIQARSGSATLAFALQAHARDCWRVEVPGRLLPRTAHLAYNEYPSALTEFSFHDSASGRRIGKSDLGASTALCERAYGFLP